MRFFSCISSKLNNIDLILFIALNCFPLHCQVFGSSGRPALLAIPSYIKYFKVNNAHLIFYLFLFNLLFIKIMLIN